VVDLRDNQGGAFDQAIATAGFFLPKGTPVVVTKKRGGKAETAVSNGDPILGHAPMKLLVNEKTSSGAELLAGALQEGRKAELIGEHTFGKWSVQTIDELGNGYAIKYTVGLFETPGGRSFEGEGLSPDIEVDMDDKQTPRILNETDPAKRLAADGQLRTAVGLLDGR
jgi:carboxyl-terminal processing protease